MMLHENEVPIDEGTVRSLLEECCPALKMSTKPAGSTASCMYPPRTIFGK
ncbi:MAG TPA: hypothetical protein VFC19_03290 [Candidatus Limnocylindrales bacterium]|nr:hypothetical protein [Candidatus Limnocylindrales bacterium]